MIVRPNPRRRQLLIGGLCLPLSALADDLCRPTATQVEGPFDRQCAPVAGAVVDLWQANAKGRYAHPRDRNPAPLDPDFQGAGRVISDAEGRYRFITIKPAPYALEYIEGNPSDAGYRPAHLHFKVSKTGLSVLTTQMYFEGDPHQDSDPVLGRLRDKERDALIIAAKSSGDSPQFDFNMHLQSA